MSEGNSRHRTQIIVAIIGLTGALGGALLANWDKIFQSNNGAGESSSSNSTIETDALEGFYVRDGLANSPVLKITAIGGNEYKLEVFNHPWPWEATVRLTDGDLTGFGRSPDSKATIDFEGRIGADRSIHSEYHFITKGDGSPANGRVDSHIWTRRTS